MREDSYEAEGLIVSNQKLTAKQRAAKVEAQRRAEAAQAKKEAAERTRKIFTIVVCVILVLALGIPTIAIAAMGGGKL